jgi:hypothetical protein
MTSPRNPGLEAAIPLGLGAGYTLNAAEKGVGQ